MEVVIRPRNLKIFEKFRRNRRLPVANGKQPWSNAIGTSVSEKILLDKIVKLEFAEWDASANSKKRFFVVLWKTYAQKT